MYEPRSHADREQDRREREDREQDERCAKGLHVLDPQAEYPDCVFCGWRATEEWLDTHEKGEEMTAVSLTSEQRKTLAIMQDLQLTPTVICDDERNDGLYVSYGFGEDDVHSCSLLLDGTIQYARVEV